MSPATVARRGQSMWKMLASLIGNTANQLYFCEYANVSRADQFGLSSASADPDRKMISSAQFAGLASGEHALSPGPDSAGGFLVTFLAAMGLDNSDSSIARCAAGAFTDIGQEATEHASKRWDRESRHSSELADGEQEETHEVPMNLIGIVPLISECTLSAANREEVPQACASSHGGEALAIQSEASGKSHGVQGGKNAERNSGNDSVDEMSPTGCFAVAPLVSNEHRQHERVLPNDCDSSRKPVDPVEQTGREPGPVVPGEAPHEQVSEAIVGASGSKGRSDRPADSVAEAVPGAWRESIRVEWTRSDLDRVAAIEQDSTDVRQSLGDIPAAEGNASSLPSPVATENPSEHAVRGDSSEFSILTPDIAAIQAAQSGSDLHDGAETHTEIGLEMSQRRPEFAWGGRDSGTTTLKASNAQNVSTIKPPDDREPDASAPLKGGGQVPSGKLDRGGYASSDGYGKQTSFPSQQPIHQVDGPQPAANTEAGAEPLGAVGITLVGEIKEARHSTLNLRHAEEEATGTRMDATQPRASANKENRAEQLRRMPALDHETQAEVKDLAAADGVRDKERAGSSPHNPVATRHGPEVPVLGARVDDSVANNRPGNNDGNVRSSGPDHMRSGYVIREYQSHSAIRSLPSELHVMLRTPDIGNMEVRAFIREGRFGASISVDRADVREALIADLPVLENALARQDVEVGQVSISDPGVALHSDAHGQSQSEHQQQQFVRSHGVSKEHSKTPAAELAAEGSIHGHASLNVHA